jgi:hypothetical protein
VTQSTDQQAGQRGDLLVWEGIARLNRSRRRARRGAGMERSVRTSDPQGSCCVFRVDPVDAVVAMHLGIRYHLTESDDAAVLIGTLVLPDRNAVARVKISAAGSPLVLIEVLDCVNYPVPSRMSGQCPIASLRRGGADVFLFLIGSHRQVPVSNTKPAPILVHRDPGNLRHQCVRKPVLVGATCKAVACQSVPDALDHAQRHPCARASAGARTIALGCTSRMRLGTPLSMVAMVRPVAIASQQIA